MTTDDNFVNSVFFLRQHSLPCLLINNYCLVPKLLHLDDNFVKSVFLTTPPAMPALLLFGPKTSAPWKSLKNKIYSFLLFFFMGFFMVVRVYFTVADPGGGGPNRPRPPPPFSAGRFLLFSGAASWNWDSRPPSPPPLFSQILDPPLFYVSVTNGQMLILG